MKKTILFATLMCVAPILNAMDMYTPSTEIVAQGGELESVASMIKSDNKAWLEIKDPKLYVHILNSGQLDKFLLARENDKINEFIEEANNELKSNADLKKAYDFALNGDFSNLQTFLRGVRGKKTNNPIVASLAIKDALYADGRLLIWYLKNAVRDEDDHLNNFKDAFFHSLVFVLHKKTHLIEQCSDALKSNYIDQFGRIRRYKNSSRFNIDLNSGLVGITPFQLSLCTYNPKIIGLLIEIGAIPHYVDAYSNLSFRYVAALRYDHKSCAKFLESIGFDILKPDINGEDALDIAFKNEDDTYVAYILYILHKTGDPRLSDAIARVKEQFKNYKSSVIKKLPDTLIPMIG